MCIYRDHNLFFFFSHFFFSFLSITGKVTKIRTIIYKFDREVRRPPKPCFFRKKRNASNQLLLWALIVLKGTPLTIKGIVFQHLKLNSYSNEKRFFFSITFSHARFQFSMPSFAFEINKQNHACDKAMKKKCIAFEYEFSFNVSNQERE